MNKPGDANPHGLQPTWEIPRHGLGVTHAGDPLCPELNVMENIWQFMRGNRLSNRVFHDHDDITRRCWQHWNRLVDHGNRI